MRPSLQTIHGQTESVRNLAEGFSLLKQTPLNIGVMTTIGPLGLARFLAQFQRDHPGIEIAIHEGSLDGLTKRLEDGELEFALLSAPMGLDDAYRAESLYEEKYVVVFAPGHRLMNLAAIRLADLSGEAYVDRLACEIRELVMSVCQRRVGAQTVTADNDFLRPLAA